MANGGTITGVVPGIGIAGGGHADAVEVSVDPAANITFSGLIARQNDPPTGARTVQIPNCRWVMNQLDAHGGGGGPGDGQGITALQGDVTASGTGSVPATVVAFQGRAIANTAPSTNQILAWNGTQWAPTNPPGTGAGGGAGLHRGTSPPPDPAAYPFWWQTSQAQLYVYTGSEFVIAVNVERVVGPPGADGAPGATGPMGPPGAGVAPGTADGQVLMWSATSQQWFPATLPSAPATPTIVGVSISNNTFTVPTTASTTVGTLSTTIVPSASWTGSYSLGGTDAASFSLSGSTLSVNSGVTTARNYSVSVTATQAGLGASPFTQSLTLVGQAAGPPPPPQGLDFTTAEQLTGLYWTDGRPVYQKTVVANAPGTAATNTAHAISGMGQLISADGIAVRTTTANRSIVPDQTMSGFVNATNLVLQQRITGIYTAGAAGTHFTLRYTKSADPATGTPFYSTTEAATGSRWITGKPVYRRTFLFTAVPGGTTAAIANTQRALAELATWDSVVSVDAIATVGADRYRMPQWNSYLYLLNDQIGFYNQGTYTGNADVYVTITYTRAADSPGTGGTLNYSTDEHSTGLRWTDNRPVYRKVIQRTGPLPPGAATNMAHGIANLGTVVSGQTIGHWGEPTAGAGWVILGHWDVQVFVSGTNVVMTTESWAELADLSATRAILYYTRSTDAPLT